MKLFNTLLEIKVGKRGLPLGAVFIEKALNGNEGTYFIYHYDLVSNTYYINDLEYPGSDSRVNAINIIEDIITKAYKQELHGMSGITKKVLQYDKPKIYCFYRQSTGLLVMDKINLKVIRGKKGNILKFKNSLWDVNDSNYVKVYKLKKNLLHFYENKYMEK